jgi:hypothetical protein
MDLPFDPRAEMFQYVGGLPTPHEPAARAHTFLCNMHNPLQFSQNIVGVVLSAFIKLRLSDGKPFNDNEYFVVFVTDPSTRVSASMWSTGQIYASRRPMGALFKKARARLDMSETVRLYAYDYEKVEVTERVRVGDALARPKDPTDWAPVVPPPTHYVIGATPRTVGRYSLIVRFEPMAMFGTAHLTVTRKDGSQKDVPLSASRYFATRPITNLNKGGAENPEAGQEEDSEKSEGVASD